MIGHASCPFLTNTTEVLNDFDDVMDQVWNGKNFTKEESSQISFSKSMNNVAFLNIFRSYW